MRCNKHGCVITETITDDVFCGVCRTVEKDARIKELENEVRIVSQQRDDTYKLLQEAREKIQRITFGSNS